MNNSFMKSNLILKMLMTSLINLPTPVNLNIWWNMGSILGLFLFIQILTGLFLSMHYCPNVNDAFNSIIHIMQNVNYGWLMRFSHLNGASMFFIFMYLHIGRNLYFKSYNLKLTWMVGVMIFLMSMMTAFIGYVLPWGQMSFWGATVITNLLSTIPYIGSLMVKWIWGGFSINNSTLNRFFTFHFLFPFIILILVIIHLVFLHNSGSHNSLGMMSKYYMIPFHLYYSMKDILGYFIIMKIYLILIFFLPNILNDPDNFILANSMITPKHIQPEWYFLFAYAILRSIPNKLGGVIALIMSILIMLILPFHNNNMNLNSLKFYYFNQLIYWLFISIFMMLTWIGMQMIEYPFIMIGQIYTIMYFSYYLFNSYIMNFQDTVIFLCNN